MQRIAIIGSGPTAIYTLQGLADASQPLHITIFEASEISGTGAPYRVGETDHMLLANIASIEIPPICSSYADWLRALPAEILTLFGVATDQIDERAFLPRVLLGAYFRDQLRRLAEQAETNGHRVEIFPETRVVDVAMTVDGCNLSAMRGGSLFSAVADRVVLATGHQWSAKDAPEQQRFASPWPSSKLSAIAPGRVGVIGTSLSGIDAAVAVAASCGAFSDTGEGSIVYEPNKDAGDLHIALMSRKGVLPEADFWCPLPYEPLQVCTPDALANVAAGPVEGRLQSVFELIVQEIVRADPEYAGRIGLDQLDVEGFHDAYFAGRLNTDPFDYAAANLDEVRSNAAVRHTCGWRYAILRMHEMIESVVADLTPEDQTRFAETLKEIFIDNYAAVPPQSIARLLALHRAGCLDVVALGDDYTCDIEAPDMGAVMTYHGGQLTFDAFIDARGQKALVLDDLPFPTLRRQLRATPEDGKRAVEFDDDLSVSGAKGQLYCAAIPFLMHRLPFVQGITACHWLGARVSGALVSGLEVTSNPTPAAA